MKLEVLVVGIVEETWFKGTRDERAVKMLNCLDRVSCAGQKIKATFDYTPSPEELEYINLSALEMQPLTIGPSDFTVTNGRLKVRGKIDLDSVPAAARLVKGYGNGRATDVETLLPGPTAPAQAKARA